MFTRYRAHKPLENGSLGFAYYPTGTSAFHGTVNSGPAIALQVGNHRLFLSGEDFRQLRKQFKSVDPDAYSVWFQHD